MQALYRKYRSESFDTVVGQPQVTEVLNLALKNNRISHGYLFVGPRGVGKTSVARILAYAINKIPYSKENNHIDIIEIDAASNTGVDNIRELIEKAQIAPTLAEKKIYIIDEVHMLSKPAFNAFLKLLEEPPKHVVFILATTDEQKIPATIISRTQRFVFKKISEQSMINHLKEIAKKEKIKIDDDSLKAIADHSEGSFRDAINLLDQVSAVSDKNGVNKELISQMLGVIDVKQLKDLYKSVIENDTKKIVKILDQLYVDNFEAFEIAKQLAKYISKHCLDSSSSIELLSDLVPISRSENQEIELLVALAKNRNTITRQTEIISEPKPLYNPTLKPIIKSVQKSEPKIEKQKVDDSNEEKVVIDKNLDLTGLNWDEFLKQLKIVGIGAHSIVMASNHDFAPGQLIIKVKNAFNKKRLDTTNHKLDIIKTLENLGFKGAAVTIEIDENELKKTQTLDNVRDIMGGGEEVKI